MEWSIQELSKATGASSRTLRHYSELGLITPSRTGAGGMRFYDSTTLPTLLRILVFRSHGMGLAAIADVLRQDVGDVDALTQMLTRMREERRLLSKRIASVERTVAALERGERLMPNEVFEEFDHTKYRQEVEHRWGAEAYAASDRWFRSLTDEQKAAYRQEHLHIAQDYGRLAAAGSPVDSDEVQAVVARHARWLDNDGFPDVTPEYVRGLGQMYAADPRFAKNYPGYAEFVRDAMRVYADRM